MRAALWDETSDLVWARYLSELAWVGAYFYEDSGENGRRLDKAEQTREVLVAYLDETDQHPALLCSADRAALREHLVELAARPSIRVSEGIVDDQLRRFVADREPRQSLIRLRAEFARPPDRFDSEAYTTTQAAMNSALASGEFGDAAVHVTSLPGAVRILWATPELSPAETASAVTRLTETVLATGLIDPASVSVRTDRLRESPLQADPADSPKR